MKEVEGLIRLVLENGLDKDPRIMALLNCIVRNPYDQEKLALLTRLMAPRIVHQMMFGKPFKETDAIVDGEVRFARTEQGFPIGFNLDEPHCLIVGQTGSGKSVLLLLILGQLL